jgi:hypothetical protein
MNPPKKRAKKREKKRKKREKEEGRAFRKTRLQAATRPPITLQKPHHKSFGGEFKNHLPMDNRHFGSIKENSECPPYLQYLGIHNKPQNSQNVCVCVCIAKMQHFLCLIYRVYKGRILGKGMLMRESIMLLGIAWGTTWEHG